MKRLPPFVIAALICTTVTQLKAQCSFSLGADKYFCQGQSISTGINGPAAYTSYSWNTGSTSQNITATAAGMYICTATLLSGDLVVNGKFSSGNTGFTTNYTLGTGGAFGLLTNPGTYAVTTSPNLVHSNFFSFGDHTSGTGNMMVCNGSAVANDIVWKQTIVVTPNTNYNFSAWVASLENLSSISETAQLQFSINGTLIGAVYNAPLTGGQWSSFFVNWNSGVSTSAVITIVDQNIANSGKNDFAIDDIFFQQICVAKDTLEVKTAPLPTVSITNPATLNCTTTSLNLNGSSGTAGIAYSWTGPGGFTSSIQNPLVTTPGTYSLTVTEPVHLCSNATTVVVSQNITPPAGVTANNTGTLTCSITSVDLNGASSTAGVNYNWAGPGGYSSSVQNPTGITVPGTYTLTVTNPTNNCTSTASTVVLQNSTPPAGVTVVNPDTLTCTVTSVNLNGNSSTAGVNYNWAGPGGYSSSVQNPTGISVPGTYSLTVTNPVNNCTGMASTVVQQNIAPPAGVTAANSDTLTCTVTNISLIGASSTPGVNYNWAGPNGYSSSVQNPTGITVPGTYTLTVSNPVNNCSSTATTLVLQDSSVPAGVTANNTATLTCTVTSIGLTGASSTTGVNYTWTGPNGYSSSVQNPTGITIPGTYSLTVTNPVNNCSSSASTLVLQNIIPPVGVTANNTATLTCTITSVGLTGASSTAGISYNWAGPNGYTSSVQNPTGITVPGTYSLTVTNPINNCTSTASTVVQQNIVPPAGATASNTATLTCTVTSIGLNGASSTAGVNYNWTGPNGYSSSVQNPTGITVPGTYSLTVTNPINNCTSTASTVVLQNITPPAGVTANNTGILTCTVTSVGLNGNSSTSGVSYNWAGPNGYNSSVQNPTGITVPGTYSLTVSDNTNGCTTSVSVSVTQNISLPDVHAGPDQVLPCSAATLNLSGSSATANAQFSWSGPNSFSSSSAAVVVNHTGVYILTVSNPVNGCKAADTLAIQAGLTPVAGFNAAPASGYGSLTVNFVNTSSNATSIAWVFGDGSGAGNVSNVSNTYGPGTYTALLIASNGTAACNDTADFVVQVYRESSIVIPNIFSPNGDLINDVFTIDAVSVKELNIIIYNRWGQVVATIEGPGASWDGSDASEGTYMYLAKAVGDDGKVIEKQGSLLLVR